MTHRDFADQSGRLCSPKQLVLVSRIGHQAQQSPVEASSKRLADVRKEGAYVTIPRRRLNSAGNEIHLFNID